MSWTMNFPGAARLARLPGQLVHANPFLGGDISPSRVKMFNPGGRRKSLPFPHPWNYHDPLGILETYFMQSEMAAGEDSNHRFLDVPGFGPVLVVRDPRTIRAILTRTGRDADMFERDTLPSQGIARATGADTLLYANGEQWWRQKKLAMPPLGHASLFQPDQFHEFETTFRQTITSRLDTLEQHLAQSPGPLEIQLEPEIKAVMLQMLVNNFFGAPIEYDTIRNHYVPALEMVIDHIVSDTVTNKAGLPLKLLAKFSPGKARVWKARCAFEELTNHVLAMRPQGKGLWNQFKSDAPDDALRSNIRVFLAGALEATTSYASWAISHLARHPQAQETLYQEVVNIDSYSPLVLKQATYLSHVLDETLRLSPSLYFLPRRAPQALVVTRDDGRTLHIPRGTHLLLDVWHANRLESHWGQEATGHPASRFEPARWQGVTTQQRGEKHLYHYGFGHGPRICPGTHLGQLEVALVVGAFVKVFAFEAVHPENPPRAGVSTKPADGTLVRLIRRRPQQASTSASTTSPAGAASQPTSCPFHAGQSPPPATKDTAADCPFHPPSPSKPTHSPG